MAFLEGLIPILAWRLDYYVRREALARNNERKRRDILDPHKVSYIRQVYQILSKGFLFRRGEILLAFGLLFDRGSSMCAIPPRNASDSATF
jgi:hypothetical protein